MPPTDSKTRAPAVPVDLIESQLNTLEKKILGCVTKAELWEYVTKAELWEYKDRRDRICQL